MLQLLACHKESLHVVKRFLSLFSQFNKRGGASIYAYV